MFPPETIKKKLLNLIILTDLGAKITCSTKAKGFTTLLLAATAIRRSGR